MMKHLIKLVTLLGLVGVLVGCSQATNTPASSPPTLPPKAEATAPPSGNTGEAYNPEIDPANFVAVIDNPYFLIPGATYIYEGETEEGLERIEVKILGETRVVMGVTTTVVRDTVYLDGELIEDTFDWFAQDKDGNVWYFGEDTKEYENGVVVSTHGAWEAGVDGALPGIVMPANPQVGQAYRQEYYVGEAEDMAEVLSLSESETVPYGSFDNLLMTKDWTPLEPGVAEHKYYAPGVGLILEVQVEGGSGRIELIEVQKEVADFGDLPTAPESARVDLVEPSFSNPTNVTNSLFPVSKLDRAILLGKVDGLPFRVETTLLPDTKIINWNGQQVETLVSQYVAYLDGRIHEVALDFYAQADDGAVWYFGEDVFNYEDGVIADTHGTWLAGRDGPAAMIMPGDPRVGDVYRPENIPGFVFEEVTVKFIGETVSGPRGPVEGAIIVEELHMDATYEDKVFAPGYGEFLTGVGGDLEGIALAVPTDSLSTPAPAELETLATGAADIFDTAQSGDWSAASDGVDTMTAAWEAYQVGGVPRMLDAQMRAALVELVAAVDARQPAESRQAALNVARASLDILLRYRPVAEIDLALLDLYARQLLIDAAADEPGAVTGDVAVLEWIWDRVGHTVDASAIEQINIQLDDLRKAADDENLTATADGAARLLDLLAVLKPTN